MQMLNFFPTNSKCHTALCGIYYYDQKGVISGQYDSLSKKIGKNWLFP